MQAVSKRFAPLLAIALLLCTAGSAVAGETGSLRGRILDAASGLPVGGATVTAVSPSQSETTKADASGVFSFISLAPDTYVVSVQIAGYEPQSESGVTIQADQPQSITVSLLKSLRTLARVSSSRGGLVRPGTTSDVFSIGPSGQRAAQSLGGAGGINQAYGAISSVPGVNIPSSQQGWNTPVYIRGGDYEQVAYEFDGIPVIREIDYAPIVNLSTLGMQDLEVYTGGTPATSNSPGLAGYINQVVKSGTYPGSANVDIGIGGPAYYHKLQAEVSGATKNRNFSYYFGTLGVDQDFRYATQYQGAGIPLYFYPISVPSAVGLAPFGVPPYILDGSSGNAANQYGAVFGTGSAFTQTPIADRESVANLHLRFPHKNGAQPDDLQFLYTTGEIYTNFYSSLNDLGGPSVFGTKNFIWPDGYHYAGQLFAPANDANVRTTLFPHSPLNRSWGSAIPASYADGSENGFSISKVAFQKNFSSNAYLRATGYNEYSSWPANGQSSLNWQFGSVPPDYIVYAHVYGGILNLADQLNNQHLLSASFSYQTQRGEYYVGQAGNGSAAPFSPGTTLIESNLVGNDGNCYNPTNGVRSSCFGGAATLGATIGPKPITPALAGPPPPAGSPAALANARWLVTENGDNGQAYQATPYFYGVAVQDVWRPTDRLTINAGVRNDEYAYRLNDLSSNYPARAFWFNAFNNEFCGAPGYSPVGRSFDPGSGAVSACPAGYEPITLSNSRGGSLTYGLLQPRLAGTFGVNSDTVLRASYGRYGRPAATAYQQYNTLEQNLPGFLSQFYPLGYTSPDHDIRPDYSDNFDFSLEHHFPGSSLSLKVTPFFRATSNQLQSIAIVPVGGITSGTNTGSLTARGVEFSLEQGDFGRDGFAARFSYGYTNSTIKYSPLPNGLNVIDVLNHSIQEYNSYTSACAGAANVSKTCGAGLPNTTGNAVPTFNNNGVVIPNPYYNQAAQPLLDPKAAYAPYDIVPSNFYGANGYVVPNYATLIGHYRKNGVSVTPTLTYSSGSNYGSPLIYPGYVPQGCSAIPAGPAPGKSCGSAGFLFVPDKYTGHFDAPGSLQQPAQVTLNLALSVDTGKRGTLTLTAANLYNRCFQHGYPWETPTTCVYSNLPSNILGASGNFITNPPLQVAYPYGPFLNINNVQQGQSSATQPFALFAEYSLKI